LFLLYHSYLLFFPFCQTKGFLNNQMAGFYRSSYTNIHGEKKIMASTQFESLDARSVLIHIAAVQFYASTISTF